MASINKATLIGNLGQDPETRYMPDGKAVTSISIATAEKWTDKQSGEMRESTEWHKVIFYGRLAEVAEQYLKKGKSVYVEGRITTRKWTDKAGIERYTTEIIASEMKMLGAKLADAGQEREPIYNNPTRLTPTKATATAGDMDDDDIPF